MLFSNLQAQNLPPAIDSLLREAKSQQQQKQYAQAQKLYEQARQQANQIGNAKLVKQIETSLQQLPSASWAGDIFKLLLASNKYKTTRYILLILVALASLVYTSLKIYFLWCEKRIAKKIPSFYAPTQIKKARRYYVPTQWQNIPPSREQELRDATIAREKVLPYFIKQVFKHKVDQKFFLVLGGSGMGKTTFMINLFFKAQKKDYKIYLFHIAANHTWEKIAQIKAKGEHEEAILLLDAFDEDSAAVEAYKKRLHEIIQLTQDFRQVVITSRTQFFPSEQDIVMETKIRVDETYRVLHKMYLSPFNETDIGKYLRKKYGRTWLKPWNSAKKRKAKAIVKKSPHLVVRPMILEWVDDLLKNAECNYAYAHEVYQTMVEKWVEREADRVSIDKREDFREALHRFSRALAVYIYQYPVQGEYIIEQKAMQEFAQNHDIQFSDLEMKTRSLLNRNAIGQYKFAHKSILEYFLALEVVENPVFAVAFSEALQPYGEALPQYQGMNQAAEFVRELYEVIKPGLMYNKAAKDGSITSLNIKIEGTFRVVGNDQDFPFDFFNFGLVHHIQKIAIQPSFPGGDNGVMSFLKEYLNIKVLKYLHLEKFNLNEDSFLFVDFTYLESLDIRGSKIKKLSYLQNLPQLKRLFLNINEMTDLKPLVKLTNLLRLDLGKNMLLSEVFKEQNTAYLEFLDKNIKSLIQLRYALRYWSEKINVYERNGDLDLQQINTIREQIRGCWQIMEDKLYVFNQIHPEKARDDIDEVEKILAPRILGEEIEQVVRSLSSFSFGVEHWINLGEMERQIMKKLEYHYYQQKQIEMLQEALPNCEITWELPVEGV